ncbi:MAG: MFS transporter [Planctomycetaceae bacterium]
MKDEGLLFLARASRMFAYGALAVVLALYLAELGLSGERIGLLFSLALAGDTAISLVLATRADAWGRKRTLLVGALLMALAGWVFARSEEYLVLVVAATLGVVSPSGHEVGPFLAVEQAALAQVTDAHRRTKRFAWYNLTGTVGAALGSLSAGLASGRLQALGWTALESYRAVVIGYALLGACLLPIFAFLGPRVEVRSAPAPLVGLGGLRRSRRLVLRLAALFSLDAFAGGFVIQSFLAYWFHARFAVEPALLGGIFFGANLLAAASALSASWLAARIGLVRTMVFTHLPSNLLLILVPLMPSLPLAIGVLFLRFSISQMDVPTRQSYTMAVVDPGERSAAAGVTGVARSLGAALSPSLAGLLFAAPALASFPFFVAGSLKIAYDLLLYRGFVCLRPPEEEPGRREVDRRG